MYPKQQLGFNANRNPGNTNVNQFITDLAKSERYMEIIDVDQWESKFVNNMNKQFPISIPNSQTNNDQVPVLIPNSHPNNQFLISSVLNSHPNNQVPVLIPNSYPNNQCLSSALNSHPNNRLPVLIPKSHTNNQFSTSVEPPKVPTNQTIYGFRNLKRQKTMDVNQYTGVPNGFVSLMSSGLHSSGSSMNMEYNGHNSASNNISNSQYLGEAFFTGSSFNEFNQNASSMGFPTSVKNVQSLPLNQSNLKLNFKYNSEDSHVNYASQRPTTNRGTYLRPRVQMSAPHQQSNQQTRQLPLQLGGQLKGQLNVFKTPQVNVWKPVQRRPRVAEESCDDISLYRKRRREILDFLGESWEEGTLFDALKPFYKLPNLEECSNKSEEDLSAVKTEPLAMFSGTKANDIITKGASGSNEQISKGSEGNDDNTTKDEFNEPLEFCFQENTSVGKEESSQVGPIVNCGLNTTSDAYESVVEPMECMTPHHNASADDCDMVLEFGETQTQIRSFNDNATGLGSGHIKIPSVSSVDCEMVSESDNTEAQTACFDDNNSGSGSGNMKIPSVSSVDCEMVSESDNTKAQTACFDDNNSGSGSGKIKIPSVSLVDCDMVSESEKAKAQVAYLDDNSSGLGSENMKIPSVTSADCDMVSESKKTKVQVACSEDNNSGSGSGNMVTPSVSLADFITASQIKQHLSSFNQDNRVILKNKDTSSNPDLCEICWEERIMLVSGSTIKLPNGSISKAELEKAKNVERDDDWVQCDRCDQWVHYICGLYNKERDQGEGAKGEYICPKCRLTEIEEGKWAPQTVLAAEDLPRTNLSDHIEQRLVTRMKQEREETAKSQGTELKNVAEAEGLVVRVVLSIDKELEVKQQFRDIFEGKDYPEKLKYRSKRLEGVDVCIFGMYVQEYGSECSGPNNRCVYISYLDSVKYFQPERKTSSGESLRTFVYHEILIGYLEYCKKQGFSTCYIWSCPVVKGQDYIFNCRPKTQKTPKEDKLLKWYKLMLSKAAKEGIVVDVNNLHKEFFVPKREENNKITAARLPYFDGAYWLGAAETISKKLEEEESSGKLCIKSPNKRTLKALGQDTPTKDLGDKIMANQENLMIVRLQQTCTSCHEEMVCGSRWFCNQCNKIQLCSRCFDSGKLLFPKKRHKCHSELSQLSEGILSNVPRDTTDRDGLLINNFFETRDDFLNKQKLVIQPVCTLCNNHVLIDQCWYCDSCLNLHVCESCYETKGNTSHNHKLTHRSKKVTPEITKNKEPEKQKVKTNNGLLDALVHASRCKNKNIECTYPCCQTIKKLIRHGSRCSVRARNGCGICKQAWSILLKHAQICADSACRIPHCMDMKQRIKVTASSSGNKHKATTSQQ
ncbi:zinc finger, TAZ-type [Artemisia annua]|uniref:histone acetyltransferase n=1 Tax=Artemisia annua TaxID=35608 RepID=A0A2U1Q3I6_ARTAN|nr:zinc finger, TAZ-type [Artemisia annua]